MENDFIETDIGFLPAPPSIRAMNYLYDSLVIFGLQFFAFRGMDYVIPDFKLKMQFAEYPLVTLQLFNLLVTFLYYLFAELISGGKTIGKMITRTTAVKTSGQKITIREAFLRSLCRNIPLEPLISLFGYILHDRLSQSIVKMDKVSG